MVWIGRLLLGLGVLVGVLGAVVRRLYNEADFLATFGVSRVWVVGLFVVALALLAVGGLLVKTYENKER